MRINRPPAPLSWSRIGPGPHSQFPSPNVPFRASRRCSAPPPLPNRRRCQPRCRPRGWCLGSDLVSLFIHDSGPVRHKGFVVAAGERRHLRRLSIQLMFKKDRKIFLGHFAECNSHLIRSNETQDQRPRELVLASASSQA